MDNILEQINDCIKHRESYWVIAGAGAGKTHKLIETLRQIEKSDVGTSMKFNNQKVAVITYTNAATDEIKSRISYDENSIFHISTIHSFIWDLVCSFQRDIKDFMVDYVNGEIAVCEEKINNPHTRKTEKYENDKINYQDKLDRMSKINKFSYSPDGLNNLYNSLQHQDVINIGAFFLKEKNFRRILFSRFPYIMIDECQDTKKTIMQQFIDIAKDREITLGLYGDMMQQIYMDGLDTLDTDTESLFKKIYLPYNYRSEQRIIDLDNSVRACVDGNVFCQSPGGDNKPGKGYLRFFIADSSDNKVNVERTVKLKMFEKTQNANWNNEKVKELILEHRMASVRYGFENLYNAFSKSDDFKNNMQPEVKFIHDAIGTIIELHNKNEGQNIKSYILSKNKEKLDEKRSSEEFLSYFKELSDGLDLFFRSFNSNMKIYDVLKLFNKSNIIQLPDNLDHIIKYSIDEINSIVDDSKGDDEVSLYKMMNCQYEEIDKAWEYYSGLTEFGTHQGVKGLEYDSVLAILDDNDAHGNFFSYYEYFLNQNENAKPRIKRTRRLFYVICSRAKKDLAILLYTDKERMNIIKEMLMESNLFKENEIEILHNL